jgi:hypothetical protein
VGGLALPTDFFTASRFYSGSALSALINVPGNRYIRVKACDAVRCGPNSVAYAEATRTSGRL